ncbi:unnamed protein product, partial [Phaeothamnion confervicola]
VHRDALHEVCASHWRRFMTSSPGATLPLEKYYRSGACIDDVTRADWWEVSAAGSGGYDGGRSSGGGSSGPSPAYERAFRKRLELEVALCSCSLTTDQLAAVLRRFPAVFLTRAEVIIALSHRISDRERLCLLVDALRPDEQREVEYRLGLLNVMNPLFPDRYYRLDLSVWDEREMAKMLVRLAMTEPGENWTDETYERRVELGPIPGWELPLDWTAADKSPTEGGPRREGLLSLWYTSAPECGCVPNVPVRLELQKRVLCHALGGVGSTDVQSQAG